MTDNNKNKSIRILFIEDSEDDALLILRDLKKAGLSCSYILVQTSEEMVNSLNNQQFDIVISDYNLPEFNGLSALRLLRKMNYDIPFILVSGQIGEEAAVEAMKEGASDYIMKSSLKRLAPAIDREIKENIKLKSAEFERQRSIELSFEAETKKIEALQILDNASKMASIGIITSSITHEINQPLNAIKLGADGILLWNKKNNNVLPETITNMLSRISDATNRIDEVIKHMRMLINNEENVEFNIIDINLCIISAISLLSNKLASQEISLNFERDSSELFIKANSLQMELTINNLIQNAAQSVLESNQKNKQINIVTYISDNKIFMEVKDNGLGLPDVPVNTLFDPMFSTKKLIGGTGLGLAIVQRFLSKINADISAYNNIDSGATFQIIFNQYDNKGEN
jgi:C4-dicarboxylate-specific signal transduction histidine kinase